MNKIRKYKMIAKSKRFAEATLAEPFAVLPKLKTWRKLIIRKVGA